VTTLWNANQSDLCRKGDTRAKEFAGSRIACDELLLLGPGFPGASEDIHRACVSKPRVVIIVRGDHHCVVNDGWGRAENYVARSVAWSEFLRFGPDAFGECEDVG